LLRTSPEELKYINKRENFLLKFSNPKSLQKIEERDHLPFKNLIFKIAANFSDSPIKPKFKIQVEKE
jgi:hypothetical protein